MTEAEIICHRNARFNFIRSSQHYGKPRVTFADEAALFLGGKEARARHFGAGHTDGDAVIYFPAHKVVHTGDLFVRGAPFIDYGNGGSSDAWMKTIDGILSLDFDTVIPGHGPVSKRADLIKWKADFEKARSRVSDLIRQGKSRGELAAALKIDDLSGWGSAGMFWKSLPQMYDELSRR